MIRLLDDLLRHYLKQVPELSPGSAQPVLDDQVGFQPPDDQWRNQVTTSMRNAYNVYLVELRENRRLRTNESIRTFENGVVLKEPAPMRLDCHYLITAWSPVQQTAQVSPTLDEHRLLYAATAILLDNDPFDPSEAYKNDPLKLAQWPQRFQTHKIPISLLPVEGFPKLSEFWQSMGQDARWKPCIYLVVTLPIALMQTLEGPPVTTRTTEYGGADVLIQIGGYVFDATQPPVEGVPVTASNAWVGLETSTGELLQASQTNTQGQFTFSNLAMGAYQLRVRYPGLAEAVRSIEVPSPEGKYDVQLT